MRVPANQFPCNLHMLSTRNVGCFPGYQKSENCKCFFSPPSFVLEQPKLFCLCCLCFLQFMNWNLNRIGHTSKEVDLEWTGSVFLITIQMQISTYKPSNFKQDFKSTCKVFLAKLCKVRKTSLNFYFYIKFQTSVLHYLQPQFQFQFSNWTGI